MLCIALGDVRLGCSCSAMETHSMKLSLPHKVWRSLAIDSADSWRLLRTVRFSMDRPSSVILHGLPLGG
ncbi:unnamed protein product [Staurois parvus]|uniref:Uncharacterized protein n=1 Tax=Staurois parvus TaxID=386267 RepID=A0ABN9AIV6_9NEOB|nr:unnamed protein product [Staurois parvus]